jgi:hypothetical protein
MAIKFIKLLRLVVKSKYDVVESNTPLTIDAALVRAYINTTS